MPRGQYTIIQDGRAAAIEAFTCAPGPMGWRYFATVQGLDGGDTRVDVSVDGDGRTVRARVQTAEHEVLIAARGAQVQAIHDGAPVELEAAAGTPVWYPSPGFMAAALHRRTETDTFEVLRLDASTLAPSRAPLTAELVATGRAPSPVGAFEAQTWRADDRTIAIADIVVIAADGFELRSYEPGATGPVARLRPV